MKKTIILLTICFVGLFIINSCNKHPVYINLNPEKSEIDYRAQTVTIHVKRKCHRGDVDYSLYYYVGNPYFLYAVKDDSNNKGSKATWYIVGPWFKVTIPPAPVKEIKVEFSENDSGEKRTMNLEAFGPLDGSCSITQNPK